MIKKALIHILNFFLCVSIIILVVISIISNTLFSKQYMIEMLKDVNYYEKTYQYIKENFSNYIIQSGIDENYIEEICDITKIEKDVNHVIDGIYERKRNKDRNRYYY